MDATASAAYLKLNLEHQVKGSVLVVLPDPSCVSCEKVLTRQN